MYTRVKTDKSETHTGIVVFGVDKDVPIHPDSYWDLCYQVFVQFE
jgi:hypothetical protein